jgi:hypothetical protein
MSFKSYALHPQPDRTLALEDPQPLIFSGPQGLIARFVLSDPARASEPWKLCTGELHALAFPSLLVRDRGILFEQASDGVLGLQWLQCVQGISGRRTEMIFSFSPLTVVRSRGSLVILPPTSDCTYNEGLQLEGGVLSPDGSWHWGRPHLALGGVVLQPPTVRPASPCNGPLPAFAPSCQFDIPSHAQQCFQTVKTVPFIHHE